MANVTHVTKNQTKKIKHVTLLAKLLPSLSLKIKQRTQRIMITYLVQHLAPRLVRNDMPRTSQVISHKLGGVGTKSAQLAKQIKRNVSTTQRKE